jgi:hypothetical protein
MARVSKKNAEYLKRCKERISAAKHWRSQNNYDDLWRRMIDMYRGKQWAMDVVDSDLVVVNVSFATVNVIGPSVAINHPKITVHARQAEMADSAVVLEQVVNYWWEHFDMLPEFQLAVKDMLVVGFGWLKSGYTIIEEEQEDAESYQSEIEGRLAEVDDFARENPFYDGELPTAEEITAGVEMPIQRVVLEERPFLERVSPFDIYVDPDATTPRNIRWIAQRITRTVEEVQNDERYKPSARRNVKPTSRTPDLDEERTLDGKKRAEDDKLVVVWEFYNVTERTMEVFADGGDDFLIEPMDIDYTLGHPFTMLRNYDVPDEFYPMGELEALEPLQHELNLTRTAMFNDRKQFRRRYLYNEKALGPRGLAALRSDDDNVGIPVDSNLPLNEIIYPFPTADGITAQMYQDSTIIEKDLVDISGVNEYMRGSVPEIRRTATEAAIIQDAANVRAADKLARVETGIRDVARRMVKMAQLYMDGPQVARIAGSTGEMFWFEFTPEDIQGEFDFEVEGGSTQPKNELQRRRQALDLLATLAPYAGAGLVNLQELLIHVLRNGFEITSPEKFLVNPMQQMQQMMMGMEPGMEGDAGAMPEPPVPEEGQDDSIAQSLAADMGAQA